VAELRKQGYMDPDLFSYLFECAPHQDSALFLNKGKPARTPPIYLDYNMPYTIMVTRPANEEANPGVMIRVQPHPAIGPNHSVMLNKHFSAQ